MSTLEKVEKNKVKLTFEVTPERFQEGLKYSYNKNKGYVTIAGFRKGRAPRKIIENTYGKDFFYDDALNHILPDAYEEALDEQAVEPVYKPEIRIAQADEATGAVFVAEVYVKPEVAVEGYYGLTYPKMDVEPTDSDIQEKLQAEREKNARIVSVSRPAQKDDIVTIDFTGYVDGEPFEGGKGENYDLTLGTHTFIDTFEDQLIGHVSGDEVDVSVTFPENYDHESLAGKPAMFKVTVLEVKVREYPEIDDEFAQDISAFDTLAEYQDSLREKIREEKTKHYAAQKRTKVLQQLLEKTEMEVPAVMYQARAKEMLDDLRFRLVQQGMSMETYLRFAQTTEEALLKSYSEPAQKDVDATLALEAVAQKESLSITDDEFNEHIDKLAERNGTNAQKLLERITKEQREEITKDLLSEKALNFILEKAVAIDGE